MPFYSKDFYAGIGPGSRQSAQVVLPLVFDLLHPRSVADIGCGSGTWLAVCRELGAERIVGIDGSWVRPDTLQIDGESFRPADLRERLDLGGSYDLVMSLEAAEHLPEQRADSFVDDLVGLGKAVLFSAAVPRQGGNLHINEQWQDYWARRFAARGYAALDCVRPQVWDDTRVDYWYAQNTLLYVARELLATNAALRTAYEKTRAQQLSLVHPQLFAMRTRRGRLKTWSAPISGHLRALRDRLRGAR